jgi:6-phosphogluconolactonase
MTPGPMTVIVLADAAELAEEACRRIADAARDSVARSGAFRIALAGGSTPRAAYELLARRDACDWPRWHVFFGDERCVPSDHADSNFRMASESLLTRVPIPAANVHRVRTEVGKPAAIAAGYERELRSAFPEVQPPAFPRFDLVLLGLGPDGHTASLFPGSRALAEGDRWVAPVLDAPKSPRERVTLTLPVLNAATSRLVLVSGADKSAALAAALAEQEPKDNIVGRRLREGEGTLVWLTERRTIASNCSIGSSGTIR